MQMQVHQKINKYYDHWDKASVTAHIVIQWHNTEADS